MEHKVRSAVVRTDAAHLPVVAGRGEVVLTDADQRLHLGAQQRLTEHRSATHQLDRRCWTVSSPVFAVGCMHGNTWIMQQFTRTSRA